MEALVCDLCGGKLVMGAGGIATCESCGMEYTTERMQEKVQEIKGKVEVTGKVKIDGSVEIEGVASYDKILKNGMTYLQLKDYSSAEQMFKQLTDSYPDRSEPYQKLIIAISHDYTADNWDDRHRISDINLKMKAVAADDVTQNYEKNQKYVKRLELLEKIDSLENELRSVESSLQREQSSRATHNGNTIMMWVAAAIGLIVALFVPVTLLRILAGIFALIEVGGAIGSMSMSSSASDAISRMSSNKNELNMKISITKKELVKYNM